MEYRIERVDTIPLIIACLMKMRTQEIIDAIFIPHTNWSGLSYGQLAVLFVTYPKFAKLILARRISSRFWAVNQYNLLKL